MVEKKVKKKGQQGRDKEGKLRSSLIKGQKEEKKEHGAGAQKDAREHGLDNADVHTSPCL